MSADSREITWLFDKYQATVYRRCRTLLGNDDAAREAVQEVFLRVLAQLERFRGDSAALTWIYSIATLYCLQQLRNQQRRRDKLAKLSLQPPAMSGRDLDSQLDLGTLLLHADPTLQQIVVLRHVDEMTVAEVAEAIGISRKTVARRLQQFIDRSRRQLALEEVTT